MMTRAQNETCDVITAAAAAAAAEVAGLSPGQNGDVAARHGALTSPPLLRAHRPPGRSLTDGCPVPDQYATARAAGNHGDATGRHWVHAGRMRNGPHGRAAAAPPSEKRPAPGAADWAGTAPSAPLNLTCQTAARRSSTATPHVVDRHGRDRDAVDRPRRPWPESAGSSALDGGVAQRRSMSTRSDTEERPPLKVRRRACWSVDSVSDEQRTVARPAAACDDLAIGRRPRQQSYSSPAADSHRGPKDIAAWQRTPNAAEMIDYCNDVGTTTPSTGHSGNVGLAEPADRLVVDAAWSRVHPASDPRPGGGGERDGASRECSAVAPQPGNDRLVVDAAWSRVHPTGDLRFGGVVGHDGGALREWSAVVPGAAAAEKDDRLPVDGTWSRVHPGGDLRPGGGGGGRNGAVREEPSSSLGLQGNVALAELADGLVVDAAWSRVHPAGDLRPSGGRDGGATARECSVVAPEPGGTAADDDDDDALRQLLRLIQQPDGQPVFLCRHCDIVYADRMLYVLHMGLHNVNNPWQCNICGTTCAGRQQFALHALHY